MCALLLHILTIGKHLEIGEKMNSVEYQSHFVQLEKLRIHYLEAGEGEPMLLVHGWPTSAYLWRKMIPVLASKFRVIALDLPGFGHSDKPLDASYSFPFFRGVFDEFVEALGLEKMHIVVHDLGGPVGLFWAVHNPEKIHSITLLNTLVYPKFPLGVVAFLAALHTPGLKNLMVSGWGLVRLIRLGLHQKEAKKNPELQEYASYFDTSDAKKALIKSAKGLHPGGLKTIGEKLPQMNVPFQIIYGKHDLALPHVDKEMKRVAKEVPGVDITRLDDCGHFIQEEKPVWIAEKMLAFQE